MSFCPLYSITICVTDNTYAVMMSSADSKEMVYLDNDGDIGKQLKQITQLEKDIIYVDCTMIPGREGCSPKTIQISTGDIVFVMRATAMSSDSIEMLRTMMMNDHVVKILYRARKVLWLLEDFLDCDTDTIKPFIDVCKSMKHNSIDDYIYDKYKDKPWGSELYNYCKPRMDIRDKYGVGVYPSLDHVGEVELKWLCSDIVTIMKYLVPNCITCDMQASSQYTNMCSNSTKLKIFDYRPYDMYDVCVFIQEQKYQHIDYKAYLREVKHHETLSKETRAKVRETIKTFTSMGGKSARSTKHKGSEISLLKDVTPVLDGEQERAFQIGMKMDRHMLITGPAGVGKSYWLDRMTSFYKSNFIGYSVAAPTGVAAINVRGKTIHSLFGIPLNISHISQINAKTTVRISRRARKEIKDIKVLIIDEVSMLSSAMFDVVEYYCRRIKDSDSLFGGIKIIMLGDFLQLCPVPPKIAEHTTSGDGVNSIGLRNSSVELVFNSTMWNRMKPEIIHFEKGYRQKDPEMFRILSEVRRGEISDDTDSYLSSVNVDPDDLTSGKYKDWTILFGSNLQKDIYNERMLSMLEGQARTYMMEKSVAHAGMKPYMGQVFGIVPKELMLKKGCRVMLIKNTYDREHIMVNGDVGEVVDFNDDGLPVVKFDRLPSVQPFVIGKSTWEFLDAESHPLASVKQIPLVLASAMTVHKSQGLTIDKVIVNFMDITFPGQAYVAMSRCRTYEFLKTVGYHRYRIIANSDALKFYYSNGMKESDEDSHQAVS